MNTKTPNQYREWFPVSWEQLHKDTKKLAGKLCDKGPFSSIVAITRGGLVPAAIIARELDIRLVETVCLTSYDWQSQGCECRVIKGLESTGKGCLVIDDLVDTGNTAKVVRAMLPEAYFVTVYAKPAGRPTVDDCITVVEQHVWVLFPWDSGLQHVPPLVNGA